MLADTIRQMLEPMTSEKGGLWEIAEKRIRGVDCRIFPNAPQTLRDYYQMSCEAYAEQTSIVYEDEHYSFAEVWRLAGQLGYQLAEGYGIEKGDRVAIAMRNYPEWVLSYLAVTSLGAVAVPMNAWWVTPEMEYGLKDSGTRLLIADRQRYDRIAGSLDALGVRCIGAHFDEYPEGVADLMELVRAAEGKAMPEVQIVPEDDASIMYTSGTTGFPKGALSTHRAVMAGLQCLQFTFAAAQYLQPPAEDADKPSWQSSILLTVPLFHVTGCVAIMLAGLGGGRKMVMMYKWDAGTALQQIASEHITAFTGVPTMVWEMLRHPDFDRYDLSSLETVGGGGAPAPVEQVKQVEERFAGRPGIGYGLTETNAVAAINSGDMYLAKPKSCGMPTILGEVAIRNEQGKNMPTGEEGEVCIKGPFVIKGYWNKPEATAESIQDGWFYSGDIGYLDEDGFLYISDRAKDMILRGGENIYCAEVENVIYEYPGIYECSVFGVPDPRLGEKVAVAILPEAGQTIDEVELQAFLAERVSKFKVPEYVFIHKEQLPRNAAGKILRRQLRDEVSERLNLKADS